MIAGLMGNLQSLLGDCQIGELPAYLKKFVGTEPGDGDETYVVFGERMPFRPEVGGADVNYSGPNQQHVKAKSRVLEEERRGLSDLVDLCVGTYGDDDGEERAALVPGGGVYAKPRSEKSLRTEIWDEAEQVAQLKGSVRASPSRVSRVECSKEEEISGASISFDSGQHSPDVEELKRDEGEETTAPAALGVQHDGCSSAGESSDGDSSEVAHEPVIDVPSDPKTLKIHREEESKLFERLNIIVHPSEEPDTPPDMWYLLDAEWFRAWSAFLKGGPRPGRISNSRLINHEDGSPWPGLEPGNHYVGMDKTGWSMLCDVYGADVPIRRRYFEIYFEG